MSIRTALGALAVSAFLCGCATTRSAADTEAQIRALEQQQVKAVIGRDRAAIDKVFAPDFMIINPSGAVANKQELLALLVGGEAPYSSGTYTTETIKVHDDVVISTGLETVVPARGAQAGQPVRRRITHVWERDGSNWRLALRHATVVTAP